MSQSNSQNPLQVGPISGIPSSGLPPGLKPEIQTEFGMGDVDSEALEMVRSAMGSNVQDTNYAYLVIVLFIAVGLLPLQQGIGDLGNDINQNADFQQLMTQFQSIYTYLESSPALANPPGAGPAQMPPGWDQTPAGAQKIQQLIDGVGGLYYGTGNGASTSPTWDQLYFTIRQPDGTYKHVYLFSNTPGNEGIIPSVAKIMTAFAQYFSVPLGSTDGIPGPKGVTAGSHVPGIYMMLFKDMQWSFDQSKSFVPSGPGGYDFAKAYGIENADGSITPSSFGTVNSSIAGAEDYFNNLQTIPTDYKGNQCKANTSLLTIINEPGEDPTQNVDLVIALGDMATTYWVTQNPTDPNSKPANQPWPGSVQAKGSLCDTLASSASNAQSSADKDNQSQMTTLQSQSQEITSEVQTGQSIQSTEGKSEASIVQNQKSN